MMVRDPVCGMVIDPSLALRLVYHGMPYYFCSHDCKLNFEDRPDEYATKHATTLLGHTVAGPMDILVTAIREGATDH